MYQKERARNGSKSRIIRDADSRLEIFSLEMLETQVNTGKLGSLGHKLDFLVAETYGEEETSILNTAILWTKNISAYIGPQETCIHEAAMAASFNIPMISYVNDLLRHINFRAWERRLRVFLAIEISSALLSRVRIACNVLLDHICGSLFAPRVLPTLCQKSRRNFTDDNALLFSVSFALTMKYPIKRSSRLLRERDHPPSKSPSPSFRC